MLHKNRLILLVLFGLLGSIHLYGADKCKEVKDDKDYVIPETIAEAMNQAGLKRVDVTNTFRKVSKAETGGCWDRVVGNFDNQTTSAGALQWNFGTGSLQLRLKEFKSKNKKNFKQIRNRLLPKFGETLFSKDCLKYSKIYKCKDKFLLPEDPKQSELRPEFKKEMKALFGSKEMIEIQLNEMFEMTVPAIELAKTLLRSKTLSSRSFHWAYDVKTQQGGIRDLEAFMKNTDEVVNKTDTKAKRDMAVKAILLWYAGLSLSAHQQGVCGDWRYNVRVWSTMVRNGQITTIAKTEKYRRVIDETYRLFIMSWLRSRYARTDFGRYQSDAFTRRATAALGVGSVHTFTFDESNFDDKCDQPKDGYQPNEKAYKEVLKLLDF